MTVRNLTVPSPTTADPELSERARASRRSFSAREKLRVLAAVDAAAGHDGAIGAILRREGLYSSILSRWRRQRDTGVLAALTPAKRGPSAAVPKPQTKELVQLRRDNAPASKASEAGGDDYLRSKKSCGALPTAAARLDMMKKALWAAVTPATGTALIWAYPLWDAKEKRDAETRRLSSCIDAERLWGEESSKLDAARAEYDVIGRSRPPYAGYPDLIRCVVSDVVSDVLIDVFSGVGSASGDFDGRRAARLYRS